MTNGPSFLEFIAAAKNGDLSVIRRYLARHRRSINRRHVDENGQVAMTALQHAIVNKQRQVIDLLLAHEYINVNTCSQYTPNTSSSIAYNDRTPLMFAAEVGDLDTVRKLCARNALVNSTTAIGHHRALSIAIHNGHNEVVIALLSYGANPNAYASGGDTPLHKAATFTGTNLIVQLFLNHNANMHARRVHDNKTPLTVALEHLNFNIIGAFAQHLPTIFHRRLAKCHASDIPVEFFCPLSKRVMNDPVRLSNGNVYDRKSLIQLYLYTNLDKLYIDNDSVDERRLVARSLKQYFDGHLKSALGQYKEDILDANLKLTEEFSNPSDTNMNHAIDEYINSLAPRMSITQHSTFAVSTDTNVADDAIDKPRHTA